MDSEHSLDHGIDFLTVRFPHHEPKAVAETVYVTHARLRENATVTAHLAALTQRQARDALALTLPKRRFTRQA